LRDQASEEEKGELPEKGKTEKKNLPKILEANRKIRDIDKIFLQI